MFFKKSDYKKLKEELDKKLADFSETGILHLTLKDLRAQHKELCAIRDEYKDRFDALEKKYVKTLNKKMYGGVGIIAGGSVPVIATASAVDLIALGGLVTGTTISAAGIATIIKAGYKADRVETLKISLNRKIQSFEKALDIKKHHTKIKLSEKHTARKAFVVAERNKQQARKIKELEEKLNNQQQNTSSAIHKKPIHKPKGQNNVF